MFGALRNIVSRRNSRTCSRAYSASTTIGTAIATGGQPPKLPPEETESYHHYVNGIRDGSEKKLGLSAFNGLLTNMIDNESLITNFLRRIQFLLGLKNKVSVVDFSNADLGDEGINKLAEGLNKAKLVDGIVEININGNKCQLMKTNLPDVLKNKIKKIKVLDLSDNNITDTANPTDRETKPLALDFIEFLKSFEELESLTLNKCNLNEESAIEALVEYLQSESGKNIKSLKIADNNLTDDQLSKVLEALSNRTMVTLDISGNEFSDASYEPLQNIVKKSFLTLETLRAAHVCNDASIIASLASCLTPTDEQKSFTLSALKKLDLTGNKIKDTSLKDLVKNAQYFPNLQELNLNNNSLTLDAVITSRHYFKKSIKMLLHNNSLSYPKQIVFGAQWESGMSYTFDLSNNQTIKGDDIEKILIEIKNNLGDQTNVRLLLDGCNLSKDFALKTFHKLSTSGSPKKDGKITVDFGDGYTKADAEVMIKCKDKHYVFLAASSELSAKAVNASVEADTPSATKGGLLETAISWFSKSNSQEQSSFRE
jgi:hypothetical protein